MDEQRLVLSEEDYTIEKMTAKMQNLKPEKLTVAETKAAQEEQVDEDGTQAEA